MQEGFESFCQLLSGFLIFIGPATEDKWLRDICYIRLHTYAYGNMYYIHIYIYIYIYIYSYTICVMCIFVCLYILHLSHYVVLLENHNTCLRGVY